MSSTKIFKLITAFSLASLPLVANAAENSSTRNQNYYFATLKAGVDQPVATGGSASVNSSQTTYNAGAEFGKKFMDIFGASLEYRKIGNTYFYTNTLSGNDTYNYSSNWKGKSDVFLLNLSVDVIKNSLITPYVKVGMGMSVNSSSDYVVTEQRTPNGRNLGQAIYTGKSNNQFAFQVGLGVNVTSNELFDIDMGYSFLDRGQLTTNKGFTGTGEVVNDPNSPARTANLRDHSVTIGLKAKF
ncbi:MAG: hypothetical protein WBJ81_03305 [Rickettsiales bacterium]